MSERMNAKEAAQIFDDLSIELYYDYNFRRVLIGLSGYKPELAEALKEIIGYAQRERGRVESD